MPQYKFRQLAAIALLFSALSVLSSSALADTGIDLIKAHAACDGSFFHALAADARRWSREPAFKRRGGLAFFQVSNRYPAGPRDNDEATVDFTKPYVIEGLGLLSYFDSDLSQWSYFSDRGLNFFTWGFYVQRTPDAVLGWMSKHAPGIKESLLQPRPGTPDGMYCMVEVFQEGRWQASPEACDQSLPVDSTPRRVFAVRPKPTTDENDESILSCEMWGAISPELLKASRPDLP